MTQVVLVLECTKTGLDLLPVLAGSLSLTWHVYFQSTSQVPCTEQGYNDILTNRLGGGHGLADSNLNYVLYRDTERHTFLHLQDFNNLHTNDWRLSVRNEAHI